MKKVLLMLAVASFAAVSCSRQEAVQEPIKVTQPEPAKGQVEAWEIVQDSWSSESDRDLVREARQALVVNAETVSFAEAVAIEANGGAIVLRGSGPYLMNMEEWQAVGHVVKGLKGVKSVEIKSKVGA